MASVEGEEHGEKTTAVERAVRALHDSIGRGELQPGEHIRQAQLAATLGMSRVPVREALKVLSTEGLIRYEPNHGYFVTKMDADEISQLYTMRRLLETEILRSIVWPSAEKIAELRALNEQMREAAAAGDTAQVIKINRKLHFRILQLSNQRLILREIERLWSTSDSYRAVYHHTTAAESRIFEEHDELIDALEDKDVEACIFWSNRHRSQVERYVANVLMLPGTSPG